MYQKKVVTQKSFKTLGKQEKPLFPLYQKRLCLHSFSKPLENVGKMKNIIVVKKPLEEEVVRDPVQVGRRTRGNLRNINDFFAVAHAPIVSPLARDLVLHGFRKPWETIGEAMFLDNRKP